MEKIDNEILNFILPFGGFLSLLSGIINYFLNMASIIITVKIIMPPVINTLIILV